MTAVEEHVACASDPSGSANVRFIDPLNDSGWDSKVAQFDGATPFHSAGWCRVLKGTYRFRPVYAVAETNGVICGLLPVMEVENFPKGRRGVSLPFTDECSTLAKEPQLVERLIGAVMDEGTRRQWNYVEFRGTQVPMGTAALSFYSHRVELQQSDQMFRRFDNSVQRAVRKAEKCGVTVEITRTAEAVRDFYALHQRTRRKHGVPPQSFGFFENICRHVIEAGQGLVALARLGDRCIAAAIFFHFGDRAIYKFGASDDRFQQCRANNLVFWKSIRALADSGITELDLGRTSLDNEGLRQFKLGWGSAESRISYFKYDFRSKRFAKDCDRASGWHTRLFRMMPRSMCRWAGAMLYRRMA
jgi:hypothetical protein